MSQQSCFVSSIAGLLLAACALATATPAQAAAEYVPPKMDESQCDQGATSGKDFTTANSSSWYFIGAKAPCTSAGSLKKFCARIQSRNGYVFEALAEKLNNDPAYLSEITSPFEGDDDAKAQALYMHPKQSLQKSLQKCGLNDAQVRAKLVTEAESASKTDADAALERDFAVIGTWAPDLAMAIWKRECEGHVFADPTDHSESPRLDKYWKANPHYLRFCSQTSADPGKATKDFKKVWTDLGLLSSE